MALRRTQIGYLASLLLPIRSQPLGTLCLTCGRPVREEHIVEGYPGQSVACKVLVRCHGAEEIRVFEMDSVEWTFMDLKRHMQSAAWFDPNVHAETNQAQVAARLVPTGEGEHSLVKLTGGEG